MRKRIVLCLSSLVICFNLAAQQFQSTNLPIIVVDTEGNEIRDEPKVTARMRIIDELDGSRNRLDSESPRFDGFIGIELRGQSSLHLFPKKGYGIETRDETGADLDVEILGMPEENDWVIHSPYSDKSLIRNVLAYEIAGELMAYAPRVRMAEMVLNGEYYGVVVWTEKIKRDKNRVDINKLNPDENEGDKLTGGYILKFDKGEQFEVGWESPYDPIQNRDQKTRFLYHYPKPEDITLQQKSYIRTWMTEFEHVLMSDNFGDPVEGYEPYIDVESFIQTIIVNELTRNVDGYRLSTYMYKAKDSDGGKLSMGPTWDHNLAWGNADYCNGSSTSGWGLNFNAVCPGDYWVNHVWWNRLMGEPRFRQRLKDTWAMLRMNELSTERILGKVDSLVNLLGEAHPRNFQRWPVHSQYVWPNQFVGNNYADDIGYLKNWIVQRTEWLDNAFKDLTTSVLDVNELVDVRVFPNPTSGYLQIESERKFRRFELFSMTGQLLTSVRIDGKTALIDLGIRSYQGLAWYKLHTEEGEVITGKLSIVTL